MQSVKYWLENRFPLGENFFQFSPKGFCFVRAKIFYFLLTKNRAHPKANKTMLAGSGTTLLMV